MWNQGLAQTTVEINYRRRCSNVIVNNEKNYVKIETKTLTLILNNHQYVSVLNSRCRSNSRTAMLLQDQNPMLCLQICSAVRKIRSLYMYMIEFVLVLGNLAKCNFGNSARI